MSEFIEWWKEPNERIWPFVCRGLGISNDDFRCCCPWSCVPGLLAAARDHFGRVVLKSESHSAWRVEIDRTVTCFTSTSPIDALRVAVALALSEEGLEADP